MQQCHEIIIPDHISSYIIKINVIFNSTGRYVYVHARTISQIRAGTQEPRKVQCNRNFEIY